MKRYQGYRVPIDSIKAGTLLKKLADREQKTSNDLLLSATESVAKNSEDIGPLTSTQELLDALDLAVGSEDLGDCELNISKPISAESETEDVSEINEPIPLMRNNKPRFVELTRLLPPIPKKGNFEVDTVRKSLYFFS